MSPANNDASFAILAVRAPLKFFALRSEIVNTFPILSVHSFERRSCLILSHPLSPLVRAPLMSEFSAPLLFLVLLHARHDAQISVANFSNLVS